MFTLMNIRQSPPPPPPEDPGDGNFAEPEDHIHAEYQRRALTRYCEVRSRHRESRRRAREVRKLGGALAVTFAAVAVLFAASDNRIIDTLTPENITNASESSKTLVKHFAATIGTITAFTGAAMSIAAHKHIKRTNHKLKNLDDSYSDLIN